MKQKSPVEKKIPYLIVGARFEILTHLHTKQLSAEWRDKAKLNQVVAAANHRSLGAKPRVVGPGRC